MFYKSKKFWYAAAAGVVAAAREIGIELPVEIVYALIALVVGQGLADIGKEWVKEEAKQIKVEEEEEKIEDLESKPIEIKKLPEPKPVEPEKPKTYAEMTPWEVEQAHLSYFEDRIRKAREHLIFVQELYRGIPQGGEEIKLAETMVKEAENSLAVEKSIIEAVKTGRAMPLCEAHYYIIGYKPPWKGGGLDYLRHYKGRGVL